MFGVRKGFLLKLGLGLLLLVPCSLMARWYLNHHRLYVYLNVFVVRDVNGQVIKHDFQFYIKGMKQRCDPGYIW